MRLPHGVLTLSFCFSLSALKWLPSEVLDSFVHSALGLLPSSQGLQWVSDLCLDLCSMAGQVSFAED